MMDTYRDEQIDRFISNEMEPAERKAFCRELETDEELQKQVKLRGLLAEAEIREAEKQAFRALAAHPAKKRKKLIWSTAAVAAIVLGILFLIGNSYRYAPADIFRTYYVKPVIEPSRGGGETATILRAASDYLIQGRAQDAIALLTPEILDSEYSEEAEWLLLCAYLHTNDREKAKVTAESIIRKDGAYTAEATAILKELKEKKLF
jgi:hypothetical protein